MLKFIATFKVKIGSETMAYVRMLKGNESFLICLGMCGVCKRRCVLCAFHKCVDFNLATDAVNT